MTHVEITPGFSNPREFFGVKPYLKDSVKTPDLIIGFPGVEKFKITHLPIDPPFQSHFDGELVMKEGEADFKNVTVVMRPERTTNPAISARKIEIKCETAEGISIVIAATEYSDRPDMDCTITTTENKKQKNTSFNYNLDSRDFEIGEHTVSHTYPQLRHDLGIGLDLVQRLFIFDEIRQNS